MLKKIWTFTLVMLILCFLCSCGKTDSDTGNEVIAGSLIQVPGREEEGLVYHKYSKTVYVAGIRNSTTNMATGFCGLYRDQGSFWKYDEEKKELVPEDTNMMRTNVDLNEILSASRESNLDVEGIILEYIENGEFTNEQKRELIEMLENSK